MQQFLTRHEKEVKGVLSGFDRLIFHGKIMSLSYTAGMASFLNRSGVLLKDFGNYVEEKSNLLKQRLHQQFDAMGLHKEYLYPGSDDLSAKAQEVAQQGKIEEGSIALLYRVEPCISYEVRSNKSAKKLQLHMAKRKCLHFYHYLIHPDFGLMHVRIQSWFPFTVQVYVNGREWLARRLDKLGIGYVKQGNCFLSIDDYAAAQQESDKLAGYDWAGWLSSLVEFAHPAHKEMFPQGGMDHYWTVHQSEWATDVNFQSPGYLGKIYPQLTRGAILSFGAERVMRFLGRKLTGNFKGELTSHYRKRPEGVCIRHQVGSNSQKLYDKEGEILRAENTTNDPSKFRVFRKTSKDSDPKWVPMRKGIADLKRRAELGQAANKRYLDALASVDTDTPVSELVLPVCRPARLGKQRIRALRPWGTEDRELLKIIANGDYISHGFRNADIAGKFYPTSKKATKQYQRKAANRTTRKLRMLRAHGIIRKIPRTHRYMVTEKGRELLTSLSHTQHLTMKQINEIAS